MTISFVGTTTFASGLSTSRTVNKPAGTTDGDILLGSLYIETTQDPVTGLSTPGFTASQDKFNATSIAHHDIVRYKRASAEGSNYQWSWTSNLFNEFNMFTYRGCISSGSPINAASTNSGSGTTATLTGITTTVSNTMLVAFVTDSAGSTYTFPAGWTNRGTGNSTGITQREKFQAAVGATGNFAVTLGTSGSWTAVLIALTPEPESPSRVQLSRGGRAVGPMSLRENHEGAPLLNWDAAILTEAKDTFPQIPRGSRAVGPQALRTKHNPAPLVDWTQAILTDYMPMPLQARIPNKNVGAMAMRKNFSQPTPSIWNIAILTESTTTFPMFAPGRGAMALRRSHTIRTPFVDYTSPLSPFIVLDPVNGTSSVNNLVVATPALVSLDAISGAGSLSNLILSSPVLISLSVIDGTSSVDNLLIKANAYITLDAINGTSSLNNLLITANAYITLQAVDGVASLNNLAVATPITLSLDVVNGVATVSNLVVASPITIVLDPVDGVASLANVTIDTNSPIVVLQQIDGTSSLANLEVTTPGGGAGAHTSIIRLGTR